MKALLALWKDELDPLDPQWHQGHFADLIWTKCRASLSCSEEEMCEDIVAVVEGKPFLCAHTQPQAVPGEDYFG